MPSGATMVLSTVPSYTAWLVVRKGANQGSYLLYDMGSSNRSWLNGSQITGIPLSDGGRISMGGSELFFTQVGEDHERGVIFARSGPSAGKSFPVGDNNMVIGRQPGDGDAQLDDSAISQRHALVRPTEEGCMIFDLGSFKGTPVNDVQLSGSALKNGDLLRLGEVELQFVQEKSN